MKAVEFDEVNVRIAEHQDEYETLPAHVGRNGVVITCFELDEEEKKQVQETGKIYLSLMTFGQPLQPIGGSVLNPFLTQKKQDNGNKNEE
nr:hypothetical protein 10 [Balneolaceae bacterium]